MYLEAAFACCAQTPVWDPWDVTRDSDAASLYLHDASNEFAPDIDAAQVGSDREFDSDGIRLKSKDKYEFTPPEVCSGNPPHFLFPPYASGQAAAPFFISPHLLLPHDPLRIHA